MRVSGVQPQEHVTPGAPGYSKFATPDTTVVDGKFDDDPVGSCFSPDTPGNPCRDVWQQFQAVANGETYPIQTTTTRRDCKLGQRLEIDGNPAAYNKTYTQGTVN